MQDVGTEKIHRAMESVQHALGRIAALASILPTDLTGASLAAMAERLYLERRRREDYFPKGLFGEPAWDLLLALFAARNGERRFSVAEAYGAAGVKPAAGRKLLARMVDEDLIALIPDPADRRKLSVELTDNAGERLSDYLMRLL